MLANNFGFRFLAGCLVAPLTPGILFFCISLLGNPSEGVWALKLSALAGYPALIVLGLPAYLLLRLLKRTDLLSYVFIGLLIGGIISFILVSPLGAHVGGTVPIVSFPPVPFLTLAAFFGALSSGAFWLIARPDRQKGSS